MDCQVMQADYRLCAVRVPIDLPCTVGEVIAYLHHAGWIKNDQEYTFAIFGRRVQPGDIIAHGERLDVVIPLPTSPVERRRALALKRKNR